MRAKPWRLKRGALVGVPAPGFAVRRRLLEAGVEQLRRWGLQVRLGRHVWAREGYLAGSDEQRTADLRAMMLDPELDALWFARGGWGTSKTLEGLPWRKLRRSPKLLIGYSDLTTLFCAAIERVPGTVCLYGPVVSELSEPDRYDSRALRAVLGGRGPRLRILRRQVLVPGRARGMVIGGNLSLLAHLTGTRFAPSWSGKILFLEEASEPVYRVERMLTQLRLAGVFRGLAGILLGAIEVSARRRFPPDRPLDRVLRECFLPLGVPVVSGLRAGHVRRKITLPLGCRARLDTEAGLLEFEP